MDVFMDHIYSFYSLRFYGVFNFVLCVLPVLCVLCVSSLFCAMCFVCLVYFVCPCFVVSCLLVKWIERGSGMEMSSLLFFMFIYFSPFISLPFLQCFVCLPFLFPCFVLSCLLVNVLTPYFVVFSSFLCSVFSSLPHLSI